MPDPDDDALDADLRAADEDRGGTVAAEAGALGRWIERLALVFALGLVAAAAILLTEVFLRYALNDPTLWAHETTVFLSGIAFIYGGLYCAARNSHIRVVLIYNALGPRARRAMDVVIYAVCAFACLVFALAAWTMVERAFWAPSGEVRLEGTGSAWNPPTPALLKGFLLVVLVTLCVQFVILALAHLRRSRGARGVE
jgi:TRAP-type C4-dicarboxylate transport system permease small subunit